MCFIAGSPITISQWSLFFTLSERRCVFQHAMHICVELFFSFYSIIKLLLLVQCFLAIKFIVINLFMCDIFLFFRNFMNNILIDQSRQRMRIYIIVVNFIFLKLSYIRRLMVLYLECQLQLQPLWLWVQRVQIDQRINFLN